MPAVAADANLDDIVDGEVVKLPSPRLPKLRMPSFGPRRAWWVNGVLVLIVLGLAVGGYSLTKAKSASGSSTETLNTAKTGIVLSSVSATGNVETSNELGVNFQQSGEVTSIAVKTGQHVNAGDELARVEDTTQRSALASAQASLASAKAQLAGKRRGLTAAEKAQDAASLVQAQVSLENAQKALDRAKASAGMNAKKYALQVEQATAQLSAARQTANENVDKYNLQVEQAEAQLDDAEGDASSARSDLNDAKDSLESLQSSYDPSASSSESTSEMLARYQADQSECQANSGDPAYTGPSDGVDCSGVGQLISAVQGVQSAQSAYDQKASAVSSAQRSVDTAKQNRTSGLLQDQQQIDNAQRSLDTASQNQEGGLLQDQQSIETSEGSLKSAQASYDSAVASNAVKEQPAKPEELAQAEASVATAQNQVETAKKNVEDTILRAPVAGTVASISGQVGGMAGSGGGSGSSSSSSSASSSASSSSSSSGASGFVVLADVDLMDVKVGFTETDAAKVKVGQQATITIDAVGGDTLEGTVLSLDVTQTVVSNVVTYYAKVGFNDLPKTVKPGMTASVSVVLDKRDDVVTLPTSAVPTSGTTATVTVRAKDGTDSQRTIGIGLRGDSAVEITSGLQAGETVVTRSTSTSGGGTNFRPPTGGGIGGGIGGGR